MAPRRRRRKKRNRGWGRGILIAVGAVPALYLLAALIGSLVPLNRGWSEPEQGTTIFIADNGIHADLILPMSAQGLDWQPLFPRGDVADPPPNPQWIAFGAGESHVYLDTPRWRDIRLSTIGRALAGGPRVMHVDMVADPSYAVREIRLRPAEYRRLWAAIRADLLTGPDGKPQRIDHPGYGPADAFYQAVGKASAVRTCNSWSAGKLRLAGVKVSAWPPFVQGLTWRYRRTATARSG